MLGIFGFNFLEIQKDAEFVQGIVVQLVGNMEKISAT